MTEQQAVYLIPAFTFLIGIVAGVLLLTYLPKMNQRTAWFIIKSEYEPQIAKLFGGTQGLNISIIPNSDEMFVKFNLIKWFDFENDCAKNYLDNALKTLHKHNLHESNFGVY